MNVITRFLFRLGSPAWREARLKAMTADVPADAWFDAEGLRRLQPVNAEFACLDADHQHPARLHLRRLGALLVALVEEGVQVSDPTGVSTFARPGVRSFQPFQGRVLAQQLRDPSQQFGLQTRDLNAASRRGDIGRTASLGSGGGTLGQALGGDGRGRLEDEVLRRFGL